MRISELSAAVGPGSPTTAPPRARPAEAQRASTGGADCVMLRVSTPGDGAAGSSADPLPNPSANPARAASFPVSAAAPREPKLAKPSAAKLRWMRAGRQTMAPLPPGMPPAPGEAGAGSSRARPLTAFTVQELSAALRRQKSAAEERQRQRSEPSPQKPPPAPAAPFGSAAEAALRAEELTAWTRSLLPRMSMLKKRLLLHGSASKIQQIWRRSVARRKTKAKAANILLSWAPYWDIGGDDAGPSIIDTDVRRARARPPPAPHSPPAPPPLPLATLTAATRSPARRRASFSTRRRARASRRTRSPSGATRARRADTTKATAAATAAGAAAGRSRRSGWPGAARRGAPSRGGRRPSASARARASRARGRRRSRRRRRRRRGAPPGNTRCCGGGAAAAAAARRGWRRRRPARRIA